MKNLDSHFKNEASRKAFINSIPTYKINKSQRDYIITKAPELLILDQKLKKIYSTKTKRWGNINGRKHDFTTRKKSITHWKIQFGVYRNYKGFTFCDSFWAHLVYKPELNKYILGGINWTTRIGQYKGKDIWYSKYNYFYGNSRDSYTKWKPIWWGLSVRVLNDFNALKYIDSRKLWKWIKRENIEADRLINILENPLLETSIKEGWLNIFLQGDSIRDNIVDVFGMNLGRKEIRSIINYYKNDKYFDLRMYKDYVRLCKNNNNFKLITSWYIHLHDAELARRRAIKANRAKVLNKEIVKDKKILRGKVLLKDINFNQIIDNKKLNDFGRWMGNCLSARTIKNNSKYYKVEIKGAHLAVGRYSGGHWEIRGVKNWTPSQTLINKVIKIIERGK